MVVVLVPANGTSNQAGGRATTIVGRGSVSFERCGAVPRFPLDNDERAAREEQKGGVVVAVVGGLIDVLLGCSRESDGRRTKNQGEGTERARTGVNDHWGPMRFD